MSSEEKKMIDDENKIESAAEEFEDALEDGDAAEDEEANEGNGILKVTGILMIAFGILGILGSILVFLGGSIIATTFLDSEEAGPFLAALLVGALLGVLAMAAELVSGIMNLRNRNNPAKGFKCMIMTMIVMAVSLAAAVSDFILMSQYDFGTSMLIAVLAAGIAVPAISLVGLIRLKTQ